MTPDRRQFLAGGAALIAGGALFRPDVAFGSAATPGQVTDSINHARFAGDPSIGRMYYGACVMYGLSIDDLEREIRGNLTVRRSYYLADEVSSLISRVVEDHAAHRFPCVSTKLPGTWADVAAGKYDSWLTDLLTRLHGTGAPVMLSLHHEPEDDAGPPGMLPSDWVAMHEHAIVLARSYAPNTTITPILMVWTFDPQSGRDPNAWLVPTASIFGVDVYNDWSVDNGLPWLTFEERLAKALPYTDDKPIIVAEYGCRTDPSQPGRAAEWMRHAYHFSRHHNVFAMSYYDSALHCKWGSYELDHERTVAMRICRQRWSVAEPQ